MASVRSLGLHYPSGLQHCIDEGILPPNSPSSAYKWHIDSTPAHEDGISLEDELLTTSSSVVWSRGGVYRTTYSFELEKEPIVQALFARFPVLGTQNEPTVPRQSDELPEPRLEKVLVVILRTQAHIYSLGGSTHVVHLPFEVQSACAAPRGIVLQRRTRSDNVAPLALKFPKVQPESFVSSQLSNFSSSQRTNFSVETLGNPKALNLGLSSTIENTWDHAAEEPDSHWPRLVCLTHPLKEIGLLVTEKESSGQTLHIPQANRLEKVQFLSKHDEILHIEEVRLPHCPQPLNLAITFNPQTNVYTVWRLTYIENEDPFLGQHKNAKSRVNRRRSSMTPVASTPAKPNFRESFGAPLPGKRQRKSDRHEKSEKTKKSPVDLVSSLEREDNDTGVTRRSSRRVSSMLARADLSTSNDRTSFTEQQLSQSFGQTNKRHESYGGRHNRLSSSQVHQIHPSLGSLLEAPLDVGLDESFHNMGLNDYVLDGLQHEMHVTKIHSFDKSSPSTQYAFSKKAPPLNIKVFILQAPYFATNDRNRGQLLLGIQDVEERRLQLLNLHVKSETKQTLKTTQGRAESVQQVVTTIAPGELRNAQNVLDSCKLQDGEQSTILILSDSKSGKHELSTQAPWSEPTKISLSLLFVDDDRHLQYKGRKVDRDIKHRKSEVIDLTNGSIVGVGHSRAQGTVDVMDAEGRLHQLRIQLQPQLPQVRRVLDTCRGILPDSLGERIHAGWLHALQWLHQVDETEVLGREWSAIVIVLLGMAINLGRTDAKANRTSKVPHRRRRPASGSFSSTQESENWGALEQGEAANALADPSWMLNSGWTWALDEAMSSADSDHDQVRPSRFMTRHVRLARTYLASPAGEAAFGVSGYMPTHLGRSYEARAKGLTDVIIGLHLLSEEQKLDIMKSDHVSPGQADLRAILHQMTAWLKWPDFVSIYELGLQEDLDPANESEVVLKLAVPQPSKRPDVFEWIQGRLVGIRKEHYPSAADFYYASARLPEYDKANDRRWDSIFPRTTMFKRLFRHIKVNSSAVQMVESLWATGFSPYVLETLPEAIMIPLRDAISLCQPHPPTAWTKELLDLVNRGDVRSLLSPDQKALPLSRNILAPTHVATWDYKLLCQNVESMNNMGYDEGQGTERQAVIQALFREDRRLNEAQDLLSTHKARLVRLAPHPSWQESEYLEKQKEMANRMATGTLAIPAGRGLLYYSLRFPLITQQFHIGGFNLNCIMKPGNFTTGVDKALFTEEKVCWGFFHQGVAAGLAISPQAKGIDTSWILYNKPGEKQGRPGEELSNRHAGFLLALGLNGHLKGVAKWVAFKYLTPKHTMTSVGLLLGLAASYMGTMDSLITRLLSVHATRMLPRGAAELNLNHLTQTSGIMGIGLLYANSQHRRMSEIMLSEIEHIEEEEEEEPLRSECYRLAAGFSLGFINLGRGTDLKGLHDMRLTEKLIAHATSTKNVEIVHVLDRAAAGAVIAIALIFMKTEDPIVARKIDVPESVMQFDYVRPDILLLRTVAKNLILWSKIEPTESWIKKSLPSAYRSRFRLQTTTSLKSTDLPFFSIMAGLCFSIALRFSGSASPKVRDLLLHYLDKFMFITNITSTPSLNASGAPPYDEELTRNNARMCQDVLALSASIVMAGTGDVAVLRRLRALHGRDDAETPYGSHLAAHLAIGSLFLGCGTVTFGTSNMAIAALLLSFYPTFPTNVMDNRSHLQAFRHFWVLATEQRCLVTKDVVNGQPVSVPVELKMREGMSAEPVLHRTTPCLLPPLDQIASMSTKGGPQYWNIDIDMSVEEVRKAFAQDQSIYLQRRPPRDSAFASTLGALSTATKSDTPLGWVFGLESLRGVSYAERAAILENGEQDEETGRAVDARLEMERGIMAGDDRERLQGARLLFEWEAARDRLVKNSDADAAGEEDRPERMWWMRDSVIEELKGKVWLASRDAES